MIFIKFGKAGTCHSHPRKKSLFFVLHSGMSLFFTIREHLNQPSLKTLVFLLLFEKVHQCFSLFVTKIIPKRNCIKLWILYPANENLENKFLICSELFKNENRVDFALIKICISRWISGASCHLPVPSHFQQ